MPTLMPPSAHDTHRVGYIQDTNIEVDEVDYDEERMQRIIISYTLLTQEDETVVRVYEFYTDDYDTSGFSAWEEFINVITASTDHDSLISYAKRYEGVMREFADICLEGKRCAAKA